MKCKNFVTIFLLAVLFATVFIMTNSENSKAADAFAEDLAEAILVDDTLLVSNSADYRDNDLTNDRQAIICSSPMGILSPTRGTSNFIILSTGIAGNVPVTTYGFNPGDERGTWFRSKYAAPRDYARLTMELDVPADMYYLDYDIRFLSAESPEYISSKYNDKVEVTVESPSQGTSVYEINVNNANFQISAQDMPGTGFDIFATSGHPGAVDIVTTTPNLGGDAGATSLLSANDRHPVSPGERIDVTFKVMDEGDNLIDSAVFIDGLRFIEQPVANINSEKYVEDVNGGLLLYNETIKYTIDISNTGNQDQSNNAGHEFEDQIPDNTQYVVGSAQATSGSISYNAAGNNITWDGSIPSSSSVTITFNVIVDDGIDCGTIISNQGIVNWDSTGDGINDLTEYTNQTTIIVRLAGNIDELNEEFSDDAAGGQAVGEEACSGEVWFETSGESAGCDFEVSSSYYYQLPKSFKTQIRSIGGSFYWNYSLSGIYDLSECNDTKWWEIWFVCENNSEEANLYMEFENSDDEIIAKLKFLYSQTGSIPPMDWELDLYCYNFATSQWEILCEDISQWNKLKIGNSSLNNVSYFIYNSAETQIGTRTYQQANLPFSDLAQIRWYSTKNPAVCPMFMWDKHILYLT